MMEWTQTGCEVLWAGRKVHQVVPEELGCFGPAWERGCSVR